MAPRNLVLLVTGALVAILAGSAVWSASDTPAEEPTSSLDVPFRFMDGSEGNLADFAGKPLVVNFWASWCPACVAEMPDFEQVHAGLGDQVVFLGLNMQETDPAAAKQLVAATGVSYLLGSDPDGNIFNEFGGIAMPTTVLIDANGTVVRNHAGVLFAKDLEEIIRSELLSS
jgi:cytochrome c biogenesis protein CcmG, thiol:disulfide interchange protein DsbE